MVMACVGDSRVLVREGGMVVKDVAQLLQNRAVSVLSELHLGHLTAIPGSLVCWPKDSAAWAESQRTVGSLTGKTSRGLEERRYFPWGITFDTCEATHCQRPPRLIKISIHRYGLRYSLPWNRPFMT